MPTPAGDNPAATQVPMGAGPAILASVGVIVTGTGFSPDHIVTVHITYAGEDVTDYVTYITDANGSFHVPLLTHPTAGTLHISATDHRPDPDATDGLMWSNICTITTGRPGA